MKMNKIVNRSLSIILTTLLLVTNLTGCAKKSAPVSTNGNMGGTVSADIDTEGIAYAITDQIKEEVEQRSESQKSDEERIQTAKEDLELFVYEKLFDEYSMCYDTFDAVVYLDDGTEVHGIGYSDFGSYFESDNGGKNFFPAGFLVDKDAGIIPGEDIDKGLEIFNLDYEDENYGFVYAYKTTPYLEHCVIDGKYLKYGINEDGVISYTAEDFSREICDESIGSLYSYDESKFLFETDLGEYVYISGEPLYGTIDYDALEAEVNRILDEQDYNFSKVDVETTAYFAKDAVKSYLLSMQQETFMGCSVDELVAEVSKLDPAECIRITPDGNVILNTELSPPATPSATAKWVVGISCGIAVAGGIALSAFVPAATPATGAICGAAIEVFMQVVVENNNVENINWSKVAVAATTGALMAWACPMGAAGITSSVAEKTGSSVLSKLAGYGFLTLSNSLVSGTTGAAYALIDGKSTDDVWDSFLVGAAVGACCTVAVSALSEVAHAGMNALRASKPESWLVKSSDGMSTFIGEHQVHLKNETLESILAPKSVYEASRAGIAEYNQQLADINGNKGGRYVYSNKTSSDNQELQHIPADSVEKLQNECINRVELNADLNKLDPQAKGNYAEMKVDRDLASKGYERISRECVTDLKTNTGHGIDGVFKNKKTGKILITETKFNKSALATTHQDGKQMSENWIENRLDDAVGKEMADKIRMDSSLNPDSVESVLAKVDLNGDISYFELDSEATVVGGLEL